MYHHSTIPIFHPFTDRGFRVRGFQNLFYSNSLSRLIPIQLEIPPFFMYFAHEAFLVFI